jgi:hypothetical protein
MILRLKPGRGKLKRYRKQKLQVFMSGKDKVVI